MASLEQFSVLRHFKALASVPLVLFAAAGCAQASSNQNSSTVVLSALAANDCPTSTSSLYAPSALQRLLRLFEIAAPNLEQELMNLRPSQDGFQSNARAALFVSPFVRVKPEFVRKARAVMPMDVLSGDVEGEIVSSWVAKQGGKAIAPPPLSGSALALVVLDRFQVSWSQQFDVRRTRLQRFADARKGVILVPVMRSQRVVSFISTPERQAVRLPLERGLFLRAISLTSDMTGCAAFRALHQHDEAFHDGFVELELPKVQLSTDWVDLQAPLSRLHLSSLFNPSASPVTRLVEGSAPAFSSVRQNTTLEVNEKGTSEQSVVVADIPVGRPLQLVFDHPFAFSIEDAKDNVLVAGIFRGH